MHVTPNYILSLHCTLRYDAGCRATHLTLNAVRQCCLDGAPSLPQVVTELPHRDLILPVKENSKSSDCAIDCCRPLLFS